MNDQLALVRALRLRSTGAQQGLAPYGIRHGGDGPKGLGYFGALPHKAGGVSTEISSEDDAGEFPLLVPTLSRAEINSLLADEQPSDAIYDKAQSWANMRRSKGMSPFAGPTELRMPVPALVDELRKKK